MTTILKLDGKNKTLAVLDLPDIHTLDADNLSTQLVGYLFSIAGQPLYTMTIDSCFIIPQKFELRRTPLHRGSFGMLSK